MFFSGYIGFGGLYDFGKYYNCIVGVVVYIDIMVLGKNYIYGKFMFYVSYLYFLLFYKEVWWLVN